jgi:hypothetical protein
MGFSVGFRYEGSDRVIAHFLGFVVSSPFGKKKGETMGHGFGTRTSGQRLGRVIKLAR